MVLYTSEDEEAGRIGKRHHSLSDANQQIYTDQSRQHINRYTYIHSLRDFALRGKVSVINCMAKLNHKAPQNSIHPQLSTSTDACARARHKTFLIALM